MGLLSRAAVKQPSSTEQEADADSGITEEIFPDTEDDPGKTLEDKVPDDETPEDKVLNDETLEDKVLEDDIPEVKFLLDPEPASEIDILNDTLEQYFYINSSFGGLIIIIPEDFHSNSEIFIDKISPMVSHFAQVEELGPHHCLLLFPGSLDRDLVAHRLAKSLKIDIPLVFYAINPAEAFNKIMPYLKDATDPDPALPV